MIKLIKDSITQYFNDRYVLVLYSLLGTGIFTELFYAKAASSSQINNLAYAFVLGLSLCLGGDYLFKDNPLLKKILPMLVALLFGFGYIIASYWGSFPLFQSHIIACAYLLFLLAPKAVREEEKTGFHWVVYVLVSLGTAISISLVLFGLIAFLVWILKQLFGIELIEYFKYLGLGFFSTFLVLNIFALFLPKPENVSSLKYTMTRLLEKTVKFFFVPVMIVYVLVLLIYSLKILIKFDLPVGMVSLPIAIAYGMYFILNAYLESQNEENLGLWKHRRWLEISFVPLFVTMGVGISKRISDYGFTIDRFYLLIGFFIIVASFLIRLRYKKLELRKLIAATSSLFFITSFGPFNPVNVSVRSQSERIIRVLQKYQKSYSKLEDFKLSEWSQKDIDSANSAMHIVFNSDGVEILKAIGLKKNVFVLVNESGKLGFDLADLRTSLDNLSKSRGFYHSDEKNKSTDERVCKAIKVDYDNRKSIYNTRGYDFLYNEEIFEKGIRTKFIPEMNIYVKIDTRNNVVSVFKNKAEKVAIDFGKPVRDLVPKTAAGKVDDALELVGEANGFRIKMLIDSVKVDCDRPELDATIFIKEL